jgi:hypothetical protein
MAFNRISSGQGGVLAKKYKADKELVIISLYLAHTIFNDDKESKIMENHTKLSAKIAQKYLNQWHVPKDKQEIIINAIEAHHAKVPTKSVEAEVMKNAECFKFVTLEGALILLHDLGRRGWPYKEAVEYVLEKMREKKSYLTLSDCKKEAKKSIKQIINVFK